MENNKTSDQLRLVHIMEAINSIEEFVEGIDQTEFENSRKIQSAVLYQFIIIGEAITSLSLETTEAHQYPWHKPRAFRNFLAHEYFGIKMAMVWNAIIYDLPELKSVIIRIINS